MKRLLALALLTALWPAGQAAQARPHAAAKPASGQAVRPTFLEVPVPIRANEPAWMQSQQKVAFLGKTASAIVPDLYIWDPRNKRLGRVTDRALMRHDLVASPDGRLAYVEQDTQGSPAPIDPAYQRGFDNIIVYDFGTGSRKAVFTNGQIVPGSLVWSHDGARLAFLAMDNTGVARLSLLESGKGLTVTRMPAPYPLLHLYGWMGDHEVIADARTPAGQPVLLRVGATGLTTLAPAENPSLSPDGRLILSRAGGGTGVMLRGAAGGGRVLNPYATSYAWVSNSSFLMTVGADIYAATLDGKVTRRYAGAAAVPPDRMLASPDGKFVALIANHQLAVMVL